MRALLQILILIFSTVQSFGQICYIENKELLQNDEPRHSKSFISFSKQEIENSRKIEDAKWWE